MTRSAHPEESLQDYLDGRLAAAAAADVGAHLETCADCRTLRAELLLARQAAGILRDHDLPMPVDLLASVQRRLDAEAPQAHQDPAAARISIHPLLRGLVATAAAAALVILYLQVGTRELALDLPALAARAVGAVGSRSLLLAVHASDAATLERYFAESAGPRVRVIDLAMMDIVLEGGVRHELGGRPSALYSYRTPSGARLVCQMYEGRLSDLPPPGDVREQNGFRFQIYSRGDVTLVFWQEGELVCVLAAELPAGEVIALAVAKAMAPA